MNKNKLPKKRIFFLLCSAVLLIVTLVPYSLGWFTFNTQTGTDGMQMKATGTFLVRPVGTTQKAYVDKIYQRLEDYLESQGMDEQSRAAVVWTLYDDSNINNYNDARYQSIRPGSSGQLKFEVEVTTDSPVYLEFDFSLIPWSELVADEDNSDESDESDESSEDIFIDKITAQMQEAAKPYLNTHIMLFTDKDEDGYYSGWISPSEKYKPEQPFSKDNKTTVTIYWVWPETLGNMILKSNDDNLNGKSIFADDNGDRAALLHEIGKLDETDKTALNYSSYFLTSNVETDVSHFNKVAANIINGTDYNMDYYMEAWRQYNKADEAIGNGIRYFILRMDVQEYEYTTEGD